MENTNTPLASMPAQGGKAGMIALAIGLLAIGLIAGYSIGKSMNTSSRNVISRTKTENNISSSTQITCTYPQILSVSYIVNDISHGLDKPEKNPMIFTFSKLDDPKVGQLSYIDSTQSITNVPIVKLMEDDGKIIYLDGVGQDYLTTHTIYKKLGISVFAKSVSLLGTPYGTLAMGSCVGY